MGKATNRKTPSKRIQKKRAAKAEVLAKNVVDKVTTTYEETDDGYHIVEYCDNTGEVTREETLTWQELAELCRAGVLPDGLVERAEEKLYGPKKPRPANDVEDFNDRFVWDATRKQHRRRTVWDDEPVRQGSFFDPVAIETDIIPWEDELIRTHGGTSSTQMTAADAAAFVMPKAADRKPILDLMGLPIDPKLREEWKKRAKQGSVSYLGEPKEPTVPENQITVRVMKDQDAEYPDLWLQVYLAADDGMEESMFAKLFALAGCKKALSPEEADLVVFGGGSDVDPQLYGESRHNMTHFDPLRDSEDIDLFVKCREKGIPMVGVCRGAQFLHVMMGGKLYQDVNNHHGSHSMWDVHEKVRYPKVSSSHHQACIRQDSMVLVGVSHVSTKREKNNLISEIDRKGEKTGVDVEAFYYPDIGAFCVQGHPEYSGYPEYSQWFIKKVEQYVVVNPDIDWLELEDGSWRRRLKPEFMEKAAKRLPSIRQPQKRELLRIPHVQTEEKK